MRTHARWRLMILLSLALVSALALYAARRAEPGVLTVAFLDIGQGDAIFIESPTGTQALVDGGPGSQVLRALGRAMPFFDRSLDVLLATHPDKDHIGGLPDVLERYRVGMILDSGATGGTGVSDAYQRLADEESNAVRVVLRRGQVVDLGGGAYMKILFPDREVSGVESNTGSIVAQVVYGETTILLTGDSPRAIEEYLVGLDSAALASGILKAGHHGSRTSSADAFLAATNAAYAVISAGCDNRYGHPHQEVLDALARFQMNILSTCERGSVVFQSDGESLVLK